MSLPWLCCGCCKLALGEYHTLLHAEAHSMQPNQRTCWCWCTCQNLDTYSWAQNGLAREDMLVETEHCCCCISCNSTCQKLDKCS